MINKMSILEFSQKKRDLCGSWWRRRERRRI